MVGVQRIAACFGKPEKLVDEDGLGDGRWIGEAGRLDEDRVERASPLHQALDDADEVAAHRAADAPIVHLEDFFFGIDDEVIVDANLAEVVHDHGIAATMHLR